MGDRSARMPYRQDPSCPSGARPRPAARARWADARRFAALDLGTNNCRLLIARPQGDGFAVIDAFSRIVRLGEGLAATGAAERRGDRPHDRRAARLRRQAAAPQRHARALGRDRGVPPRDATAPSSSSAPMPRPASGSTSSPPRKKRGWRCSAATRCSSRATDPALIFDIGGGSTELVLVDTRGADAARARLAFSAPWGVVSLTEHAGGGEGADGRRRRLCADARARRGELRRRSPRRLPPARRARRGCSAPAAR